MNKNAFPIHSFIFFNETKHKYYVRYSQNATVRIYTTISYNSMVVHTNRTAPPLVRSGKLSPVSSTVREDVRSLGDDRFNFFCARSIYAVEKSKI